MTCTTYEETNIFDFVLQEEQTNVSMNTNLVFEVVSDGYDIDVDTLVMTLNNSSVVLNGIINSTNYSGTITEIVPDNHYRYEIDGRYLLQSSFRHVICIYVQETVSGRFRSFSFGFETEGPLDNPQTLYIGYENGIMSIDVDQIDGYSSNMSQLIDGYYVNDLGSAVLNEINRLYVSTRDSGAIVYSTNYTWPTVFYSIGDEITKAHLSCLNNGTLYLSNRSRRRVDVYYNILADDVGRNVPDVYYASDTTDGYGSDGYVVSGILDGYFTDMVITEGTSSVSNTSSTIFLGTQSGVFKIDTDESSPGNTEVNGVLSSYGIPDGGFTYGVLDGNNNKVAAIDVNTRLNHLYVATSGVAAGDSNVITYIDLSTNTRSGVILEAQRLHNLTNDINFQD